MHPNDLTMQVARQRQRDYLADAEQRRRVSAICGPRPALTRRVAAPLGHALVRLGARLLRYGRGEAPVVTAPYRASSRSIRLN